MLLDKRKKEEISEEVSFFAKLEPGSIFWLKPKVFRALFVCKFENQPY